MGPSQHLPYLPRQRRADPHRTSQRLAQRQKVHRDGVDPLHPQQNLVDRPHPAQKREHRPDGALTLGAQKQIDAVVPPPDGLDVEEGLDHHLAHF